MAFPGDLGRMETIYKHMWSARSAELLARLDQSLYPRSPSMLYDFTAELGINAASRVLDAGCGMGTHSCGLAARYGCAVVGLDLAESNLKLARTRTRKEGLSDLITYQHGDIQNMPFSDAMFDLVWCRDMLVHVRQLGKAFAECTRVLKPGGAMIIHTTFATDLLEPKEAAWLYEILDIVPENMSPAHFEETCDTAGLQMHLREEIGSEWLEYAEEQQEHYSQEILHIARMKRAHASLVADFGQSAYDVMLAVHLWNISLLLGKLNSTVYVLRKVTR
jgi:ubiquinone/menaquinone biosynthesis C-methylase UbiE